MARTNINNGDTGLTVRTELNAMFTELYAGINLNPPVKLVNQTGNIFQAINADTWIQQIFITPNTGTSSIKIGITSEGNEILDTTVVGTYLPIVVQTYFPSAGNLYFAITGGSVNIRIDLIPSYK